MSFRLVSKSVTMNDLERRNGRILRCFTEFVYDVVVKQLPRFQNLLLIVYDHINLIWGELDGRVHFSSGLITRCDGRRCLTLV